MKIIKNKAFVELSGERHAAPRARPDGTKTLKSLTAEQNSGHPYTGDVLMRHATVLICAIKLNDGNQIIQPSIWMIANLFF